MDYSGDGLVNPENPVDFALLVQAVIVPDLFDNLLGTGLDFSALVSNITSDLYIVASGSATRLEIGAEIIITMGGICNIHSWLEPLCDFFDKHTSLTVRFNFYWSERGIGILVDIQSGLRVTSQEPVVVWLLKLLGVSEGTQFGMEIQVEFLAVDDGSFELKGALVPRFGIFDGLKLGGCSTHNDCGIAGICLPVLGWCVPKLTLASFADFGLQMIDAFAVFLESQCGGLLDIGENLINACIDILIDSFPSLEGNLIDWKGQVGEFFADIYASLDDPSEGKVEFLMPSKVCWENPKYTLAFLGQEKKVQACQNLGSDEHLEMAGLSGKTFWTMGLEITEPLEILGLELELGSFCAAFDLESMVFALEITYETYLYLPTLFDDELNKWIPIQFSFLPEVRCIASRVSLVK